MKKKHFKKYCTPAGRAFAASTALCGLTIAVLYQQKDFIITIEEGTVGLGLEGGLTALLISSAIIGFAVLLVRKDWKTLGWASGFAVLTIVAGIITYACFDMPNFCTEMHLTVGEPLTVAASASAVVVLFLLGLYCYQKCQCRQVDVAECFDAVNQCRLFSVSSSSQPPYHIENDSDAKSDRLDEHHSVLQNFQSG